MVEKEQSLAIEKKRFAVGCRQSVVVKIQNEKPFFSSKIAAKDVVNNKCIIVYQNGPRMIDPITHLLLPEQWIISMYYSIGTLDHLA